MDLENDCKFLYGLNPLPEWRKSWRDFEKDGDWNDALYPIGNGIKQARVAKSWTTLNPE
jgi:hypothetical protein